jgi:hypothetical protein
MRTQTTALAVAFLSAAVTLTHGVSLAATNRAGGIPDLVPKPPPKYWSPARCKRMVLNRPRHLVRQALCVGSGGPQACRANADHVQLYSEFTVFVRYRVAYLRGQGTEPGVIRSFTLSTRPRRNLAPIAHSWGAQYIGWPPDFYAGHTKVIATHVPATHFTATITPIATPVERYENAITCTGQP